MFSKKETQTLVKTRKHQIFNRVVELLENDNISSREDITGIGICTDRYLQDHPELLAYLRATTAKLTEVKYGFKLDMAKICRQGYFSTKSLAKQLLYNQRKKKVLDIIRVNEHSTIKGVARQIPCSPSYLRASGLSSLIDAFWA
jgi:hypothetical protein